MKIKLTLLMILTSFTLFGQNDSIRNLLNTPRKIVDCEVVSLNAIDLLYNYLQNKTLDSMDIVTKEWISMCGLSECTQRIIILKTIMEGKNSNEAIKVYFENGFQYSFINRLYDSRRVNYGYYYSNYKAYYGYVSLRHPIDSLIADRSAEMLNKATLSLDEKMMCILFCGDIDLFELEYKKNDGSYIHNFYEDKKSEYKKQSTGFTFTTGIHSPIGKEKVFGPNPFLGFYVSSPLNRKFIVDIGISFRVNNNSEPFKYNISGDTMTTKSELTFLFGGTIGYKIFENKHIMMVPKFGIGGEGVGTELSKINTKTQEKESVGISALHLSLGMTAYIPVISRQYLGIGLTYHFCPYNLDKNLITKFDQHAVSFDVSFRL